MPAANRQPGATNALQYPARGLTAQLVGYCSVMGVDFDQTGSCSWEVAMTEKRLGSVHHSTAI
jgi:hypothetical protein